MPPKRKHEDEILTDLPEAVDDADVQTKRPRTEQTPNRNRRITRNGTLDGAFPKTNKKVQTTSLDIRLWGWIKDGEHNLITAEQRRRACGFASHPHQPICPPPRPPAEVEDQEAPVNEVDRYICSKKNCRFNPQCLNHIGQDKWDNSEVAKEAYLRGAGLGHDPASDLRDPSLPVGLKNLGATCYANAYLQVWFQDLAFRSGVYRCLPSDTGSDPLKQDASPIYQLQLTFAALQMSRQKVFDPFRLVESLQLQKSEQQDAQEFSKLFLSLLASEFAKQSEPSLRSLVSDQFEGKLVYGTMCSKCLSKSERETPFLELEITLEPQCTLESRIRAILASERLSGDNKYHCSNCDSLQNAWRYTRLKSLPPVLHFSIMRFVFDVDTMTRKKSKQKISFPSVLDMGDYLDLDDLADELGDSNQQGGPDELDFDWRPNATQSSSRPKRIYDLTGVLLHKGASAYHGHYESQVLDVTNSTWYEFNDEEVQVVDPQKSKTPRKTSTYAYMLIYAKREDKAVQSSSTSSPIRNNLASFAPLRPAVSMSSSKLQPPAFVKEEVERLNGLHKLACDEYDTKYKLLEADFIRRKELKEQIFNCWRLKTHDEPSMVVDRSVLENWVTRELTPSSHDDSSASPSRQPRAEGEEQDQGDQLSAPQQEKSLVLKRGSSSSDSEATLLESPLSVPPVFSNAAVICRHGALSPTAATHSRRISMVAYASIVKDSECRFEPEVTSDQICHECVAILCAEKLYPTRHQEHIQCFKDLQGEDEDRQNSSTGYWLSKSWLKDWKLARPSMRSMAVDGNGDPPPDTPPWKEDVTCEHGQLAVRPLQRVIITDAAHDFLKSIFPSWKTMEIGAQECLSCQENADEKMAIDNSKKDMAEAEKAKLKALLDRSRLFRVEDLELGQEYFLIAASSLLRWKRFMKNPVKETPPEDLGTHRFICQHSLLQFDPYDITDVGKAFIPRSEFEVFAGFYPRNLTRISIVRDLDDPWNVMLGMDICEPCTRATKTDFTKTDLDLRILLSTDPDPSPSSYFRKTSPGQASGPPDVFRSDKNEQLNPFTSSLAKSTRRSGRIAQQSTERATYRIKINKTDTFRCIQEKITIKTDIRPYYQQLFHHGRDISGTDAEMTAGDLGITINDTLEVKDRSLNETDAFWSGDVDLSEARFQGKLAAPEEGRAFHGTLLSGGSVVQPPPPPKEDEHLPDSIQYADADMQENAIEEHRSKSPSASCPDVRMSEPLMDVMQDMVDNEMTNGPTCPACTFINPEGVSSCTICDTPF